MGEDWDRPKMPTKAMLELYFGGDWRAMTEGRIYALGAHTPVPHTFSVTSLYGMLRATLRLNEGGLFIAVITYDDLEGPLVQSAGATFTEALSNALRAYRNTVNSLPSPLTELKDERGAYYRQHLKRRKNAT